MRKLEFRKLTEEDVEVRPTNTKYKGSCELLLYIDSRAATDILNEAVGPFNWNMEYKEVAGKTYGRLSIWDEDKQRYAYKEDTGSESNIEADKGLASDILKRCLARWGCDALYSTPKIKIECPDKYYFNDKMTMKFSVSRIVIDSNNKIADLEIVDRFGKVVYSLGKESKVRYTQTKDEREYVEDTEERDDNVATVLDDLSNFCGKIKKTDGVDKRHLVDFYHYYADKIKFEGFQPRSFKALWTKWEASPNRKTDDERRSKLTKIADNE